MDAEESKNQQVATVESFVILTKKCKWISKCHINQRIQGEQDSSSVDSDCDVDTQEYDDQDDPMETENKSNTKNSLNDGDYNPDDEKSMEDDYYISDADNDFGENVEPSDQSDEKKDSNEKLNAEEDKENDKNFEKELKNTMNEFNGQTSTFLFHGETGIIKMIVPNEQLGTFKKFLEIVPGDDDEEDDLEDDEENMLEQLHTCIYKFSHDPYTCGMTRDELVDALKLSIEYNKKYERTKDLPVNATFNYMIKNIDNLLKKGCEEGGFKIVQREKDKVPQKENDPWKDDPDRNVPYDEWYLKRVFGQVDKN